MSTAMSSHIITQIGSCGAIWSEIHPVISGHIPTHIRRLLKELISEAFWHRGSVYVYAEVRSLQSAVTVLHQVVNGQIDRFWISERCRIANMVLASLEVLFEHKT